MTDTAYPHVTDAIEYAEQVLDGEILACKWVKLACQRFFDDLERWGDGEGEYRFDPEKAEKVCEFVEKFPHVKGEWAKRSELLKLSDWQKFINVNVFGWVKPDGSRRFKTVYIEVPKKNGKTSYSAPIGHYMLAGDGEPGSEVYSAASTRDQAKIVFEIARTMAKREPGYREKYNVEVYKHSIAKLDTASSFKPLSSEADSFEGINPHMGLVDELHAHKTREVYDGLDNAMGSRLQSLMWNITTAGNNRAGICYEQHLYVKKILEGIIQDETYFGIIYTIDDDDDWREEDAWKKANPNYGVSVYPHDIERLAKKAEQMASAQNSFLTKRLNIWVNADTAWMNMRAWDKCEDKSLTLEDFKFEPCHIGIDLASKIDVASKGYVFKKWNQEDGKLHYYIFCKHYLPEDNVEAEGHAKSAHFQGWSIDGWVTLTPGNMIDLDWIEDDLKEDMKDFDVREMAYDPWQSAQLAGHMMDEGAGMVEVRPTVQNFSDPMKELEALCLAGRIHHNGDPCLTWMVSNVVCHRDNKDNIYPRKEQDQNKIDGVVALLMAMNRALSDHGSGKSVYHERGMVFV